MKKITLLGFLLISQIFIAQTVTTFSTGYNVISGIAISSTNEVYVAEYNSTNIYSLDDNGIKTLFTNVNSGSYIADMDFDANDELFIADPNGKILKVDTSGITNDYVYFTSLHPSDVAMYDDIIYSSIRGGSTGYIYKIHPDLTRELFVTILNSTGITFDNIGNLYVANFTNHSLDVVAPDGTITSVATNMENISDVAVASDGKVYFTMYNDAGTVNKIMKYDPTTAIVTDFVITNLDEPRQLAIDNLGNMYVTNRGSESVIKIYDDSLLPDSTIVYIPDSIFKTSLLNNSAVNTNGDSEIQFTEAANYTGSFYYYGNSTITDLTGIEAFTSITAINFTGIGTSSLTGSLNLANITSLTSLKVSNTLLENIDISGCIALEIFKCSQSEVSNLNLSGCSALLELNCLSNNLSSLDVTECTQLEILICAQNNITELDVTNNTQLISLSCLSNNLSSIDVTNNTQLIDLNCSNNNLTSLNISNNTFLKGLSCYSDNLNNLDISNNDDLVSLSCSSNNITNLNVLNKVDLTFLRCTSNNLTSIDITNNTQLTYFDCGNNNLMSLDVSNNPQFGYFLCYGNNLTSLDVSNNQQLEMFWCQNNNLNYLDVRNEYNTEITDFRATSNPNLTCIFVDDATFSTTNWVESIDSSATFVEDEATCIALSVSENEIFTFKVYPNPTEYLLNIDSSFDISQINIYNEIGQLLISNKDNNSIDISKLAQGVYFLKIKDKQNNTEIQKFIKE